jgi:hypothetical protein
MDKDSYRGAMLTPNKDGSNRRESVNGHRFPMPHLSGRGDERVEMGHRPQVEIVSLYGKWDILTHQET